MGWVKSTVASMDGQFWAALIGAVVAVLGSATMLYVYESWKARRDRRNISEVLYRELFHHAQGSVQTAAYLNEFDRKGATNTPRSRDLLLSVVPSDPIILPALAGRLHEIGAISGNIVAYYAEFAEAKRMAVSTSATFLSARAVTADEGQCRLLIVKWRSVCNLGAIALELFHGIAPGPTTATGRMKVANLVGNLRNVRDGALLPGATTGSPEHLNSRIELKDDRELDGGKVGKE